MDIIEQKMIAKAKEYDVTLNMLTDGQREELKREVELELEGNFVLDSVLDSITEINQQNN